MDHLKTFGIKFIVTAIAVFSIFGILFNTTLINLFWISLLVTGISYLVGDLFILKRFNNITAIIADFGLAFLSLWLLGSIFLTQTGLPIITLSAMAAFFITLCEPFIHAYIREHFSDNTNKHTPVRRELQTEFSEELDVHTRKKDRSDD
ncbi:YndM family protein [Virgibacillus ndiopensis]|uniref:YndM family protein n=1 Tax=Virgibacillus ndiopensis TaxID=2004408 RepID=UPI000C088C9E|nr:YndM family protein [Virgibacillus ndiopensis]